VLVFYCWRLLWGFWLLVMGSGFLRMASCVMGLDSRPFPTVSILKRVFVFVLLYRGLIVVARALLRFTSTSLIFALLPLRIQFDLISLWLLLDRTLISLRFHFNNMNSLWFLLGLTLTSLWFDLCITIRGKRPKRERGKGTPIRDEWKQGTPTCICWPGSHCAYHQLRAHARTTRNDFLFGPPTQLPIPNNPGSAPNNHNAWSTQSIQNDLQ
jgi:hypothetical protein